MPQPKKLTPQDKEEIKKRSRSGEKAAALAEEFGVSKATIYVQAGRKTPPATKKPKYIDVPLDTPQKVAVIITDTDNIASVIGGLWR